jgi:hypothetical protein
MENITQVRIRTLLTLLLVWITLTPRTTQAQLEVETRQLIDTPTAGLLPRGKFDLELRIFKEGGILTRVSMGIFNRFLLGVSYGGSGIIGDRKAEWNQRPEVVAKYRLFDETVTFPALALGFDSQGYGAWNENWGRYDLKSPGFYLVASKNYRLLGQIGFHGGVNYSLERGYGEKEYNAFAGFDKSINPEISIIGEYDLALNDSVENCMFGEGKKGYLNAGVRWNPSQSLWIEIDVKDILENSCWAEYPNRELRIFYIEAF